jgi:hypothetical protein
MSLGRIVLLLGRLLTIVVLVASGAFLLIYLVRWEWNRAIVAGIFFLGSEAVLLTSLVLSRVQALTGEVERSQERAAIAALAARLRANRPQSAGPFAWLSPDPRRTHVLLPILIGAGVILSAISYVVEQLSRVTAAPVAEHELARGLARMALPQTSLTPLGRPTAAAWSPDRASNPRPGSSWGVWVALAGIAAAVTAFILVLVPLLITVPAPADAERTMHVDLLVIRRDLDRTDADVARALWAVCRVRVHEHVKLVSLAPVAGAEPGTFRMTLSPAPGTSDAREFLGCLQDAVIERARTDVTAVTEV